MFDFLLYHPLEFLIWAASLLIAVTIHEFSHAWTADKLGDPTPRLNRRLTLNPLAHLDPLGTLALLIAHVGWGKPVPIDAYNLRNPRRDAALISLAGPGSNLILAFFLSLLLKTLNFQLPITSYLIIFIPPLISLNVSLAIFNLLPIPPLDGAKILLGFLPPKLALSFEEAISQYGLTLLIILLLPFFGGVSLVSILIFPIINAILSLLL